MLRNGLYITATPIGNLHDISKRALEVLNEAPVIACEDTRVTKKLLSLLGVSLNKKFITCEDHNESKQLQKILEFAQQYPVVLVSDAGSPLISDPGFKLARLCREQNIYVTAIPGACAAITALQLSGLPTDRFMFAGFIPNKDKARNDLFAELKDIRTTLIFYETAPRLLKTLEQAQDIFKHRDISVARELTKLYEEVVTGDCAQIIAYFNENPPKGEFVLIIAPPTEEKKSLAEISDELRNLLAQTSLKSAVKEICLKYSFAKNEVYDLALELKNEKL